MKQDAVKVIHNILNVNHAAEFGAVWLYKAQMLVVNFTCPHMKLVINEVREDERRHRDIFRKMMLDYGTRPCRLTWIWVFSGFFLGIVTALLGKRGMLISMKAMETTAHEHLGIQVSYLKYKKYEIYKIIEEIQIEEIKHVSIADKEIGTQKMSKFDIFIYKNVYRLCQLTMWVVTKGESTKLRNFLFLQSKA